MAESTGDLKHGIISLSKPHWVAALAQGECESSRRPAEPHGMLKSGPPA